MTGKKWENNPAIAALNVLYSKKKTFVYIFPTFQNIIRHVENKLFF